SDYRKHLNKVSLKSKFLNRVEKKSGLVDHTLPVSELSIEKKPQAEKFNELSIILFFEKHITCLINEANVRSITEFIIIGKIKHMQL
ncbi:hypothetical protein ALC56_02544, partial [Trachymyrmex septentrionalis]